MSTQIKTSPAVQVVTSGHPVPVGSGLFTNLAVSNVNVTSAGLATITFTTAHGITVGGTGKVTFWNVATNTWLNMLTVSTVAITTTTIQFYTTSFSSASNGADTGSAIVSPVERYRVVRLEIDKEAGTSVIYIGDQFLTIDSSSGPVIGRYAAALSLAGQLAWEISGEGIDPCLIWVDASAGGTYVQVSLVF